LRIWKRKRRSKASRFEDFKDQIRTNVITQQVIGREVGGRLHITNEEVQAFYNEHQKDMAAPETVTFARDSHLNPAAAKKPGQQRQSSARSLPEDPAQVKDAEAKRTSFSTNYARREL